MRVGIYTHYAHCDAAYLAVRLAELAHKLGHEVEFYTDDQPGKLGIPYDRAVVTRSSLKFTDWARKNSVIVWTHVPRIEQINYAKRKGIRTIIVPMWQELLPPFKKTMQAADVLVSMCTEAHSLFSEVYKIRSAELIPFDTGLPIIKKTTVVNERKIKVLIPWFDRNARCAGGAFLDNLRFLVAHMPEIYLTVAITPSKFSPAIAKFFSNLRKACKDRVTILRSVPVKQRHQLFNEHDLTVYPSECDNYGLCSLLSLTAGTPVLSTAISPQLDFLYPDSNSVLVSTKLDYDENGVVHALPDYEKFVYVLQELVAEPRLIQKLNNKTNYNLNSRRKAFEMSWTNIFEV